LAREAGGLVGEATREQVAALRSQPARVWQTTSGARVAVANKALRLVKILAVGVVAIPLAVWFCQSALLAAWSWQENAPRVNEVALADLDGDGSLDAFLAVGRGSMPFPAYALYNDGSGRLGSAHPTRQWPGFSAALGDLNGDGRVDALLDITAGGIELFLNQPDGLRERVALAEPGPKGVMRLRPVIGDLNGDGRLDVFAAGCCGRPGGETPDTAASAYQPPYSRVWLQTAEGRLRPAQQVGEAPSNAVALGDLDGDGHLDAFLANGRALEAGWTSGPPQPNTVWFNDGQGSFRDSGQQLGATESLAAALGDVDGDGCVDAVVGNRGPDEVWLNDCQGVFHDSGQRLGSGSTEYVFMADLDGDGDLDWLAAGPTQTWAWFNDGAGHFDQGRQRLRYSADDAVALGDLNGDGLPDLLVAGVSATRAWLNNGQGRFSAAASARYR
jgi:hypothetical protein